MRTHNRATHPDLFLYLPSVLNPHGHFAHQARKRDDSRLLLIARRVSEGWYSAPHTFDTLGSFPNKESLAHASGGKDVCVRC